ncbi:VCBS repeat-containing protein [Actinacidiphila glaucinigra]|uniref:VCBS repeat-containing protein n=1 Tax=Actinacidiphila glaucinigra TaxID=235986 RepID=UPI0033B6CCC8
MARHALVRGGLAALISTVIAAGLGSFATDTAQADTVPQEVVVPAAPRATAKTAALQYLGKDWYADGAGALGLFHTVEGLEGTQWTRYSDGRSFPVPAPTIDGVTGSSTFGTGTDAVAYYSAASRQVELRDMASGTSRVVTVPEGLTYLRVYGTTVVAYRKLTAEDGTTSNELHLLTPADDGGAATRDRIVTGMPPGSLIGAPIAADPTSLVFAGRVDGTFRYILVDAAGATVTSYTAAGAAAAAAPFVILTADHIGWYDQTGTLTIVPRSDAGAQPAEVPMPSPTEREPGSTLAVVGDWLVYSTPTGHGTRAVPLAGGSPITLLARGGTRFDRGPGGTAAVIGGSGSNDWGIRRIVEGPDGRPSVSTVVDLSAPPAKIEGLALGQGNLIVTDSSAGGKRYDYRRTLSTHGTPAYADRDPMNTVTTVPGCAAGNEGCRALFALGDGSFARVRSETADQSRLATVHGPAVWYEGNLPPGGRITDAHLGNGVYTVPATGKQYVWSLPGTAAPLERPATAAAVWAGALWTPGGTPGTVTVLDIATRRTTATVDLGSSCVPTELQVLGRWIYWSCGAGGPAGVHDRTTRRNVTVPADEALLGDGFVVTHDRVAGKLVLTDVHTGAPASRVIGDLPDTGASQRRLRWDVDRSTDRVAYADASERVHVVATGVPAQPLTELQGVPAGDIVDFSLGTTYRFSKPGASWRLVVKRKATGATVRTLTGGETRGFLYAGWDGRDAEGDLEPNGVYTWTITVKPADGSGADFSRGGSATLTHGDEVWRDFAGQDGLGEVFGITAGGTLDVRTATGKGTFARSALSGIVWGPKVTVIPVGDLTGDNCNDVLVRRSTGATYRYSGTCGKRALGLDGAGVLVGTGWNGYNVLTAPGDLSGDGRPDLIARQSATSDVYLYRTTSAGKLVARVKLASKWTGYKKIVGTGDLTGDGIGDLVVQDKANVLWRYDGDGKGHLRPRVKLASSWGASYSVVVGPGDITGDGKADLIARDAGGVLWRHNGTGKGTFGGRTKIGTGWNGFKGLF